jgi:hypothetical protein
LVAKEALVNIGTKHIRICRSYEVVLSSKKVGLTEIWYVRRGTRILVVVDIIAYVVADEKLLLRVIIGLMKVLAKVTFLVLADELIIWILILLGKHCLPNSSN